MNVGEHIFISYARSDGRVYAERLYKDLMERGILAWRDTRNLDPYQDFTAELEKGIEQASHVAVCLTPDTKRDNSFVRREIGYAMTCNKPIIPLMFAEIPALISIVNVTRIEFFHQTWDKAFMELLQRLAQSADIYGQPSRPDDLFRDYLDTLYRQIVHFLNTTVFSLVLLHSEARPEALEPKQTALLTSFFSAALPVKETAAQSTELEGYFEHFPDVVQRYAGRVLVLGEPGAGKTTTLMAFARDAVARRLEDPGQPLPLLGRISDWPVDQAPALADWLGDTIGATLKNQVAQTIADGNALLFLDGLDELGREREDPATTAKYDPRQRFIEMIPPNNQVLVSCRVKDYADIGTQIALNGAVTLQPLDNTQVAGYLRDYPDLMAAVQADDALNKIARTPLLLSIFTYSYRSMNQIELQQLHDLAHSPGELRDRIFKMYIERRYEHEKLKAQSSGLISLELIYGTLGYVAMIDVIVQSANRLSLTALLYWLGEEARVRQFVETAKQLHLLVSGVDDALLFPHLLLRDYFAFAHATAALNHPKPRHRGDALQALGDLGDERSIPGLVEHLTDTGTFQDRLGNWWFVWQIAESALLSIGAPEALASLDRWRRTHNPAT